MKGEKQLFGRNGNIAPQKHQETPSSFVSVKTWNTRDLSTKS